MTPKTTSHPRLIIKRQSRKNLPRIISGKRAESNFVLAFGKAYMAKLRPEVAEMSYSAGREVPISGFGVADFVWVAWRDKFRSDEGHAIAGKRLCGERDADIVAFEMKMKDWTRGLAQATRYRFFANTSYLVLPTLQARLAYRSREAFKAAGVGLIGFDMKTGYFRTLLRPVSGQPLSDRAHGLLIKRLREFSEVTTAA